MIYVPQQHTNTAPGIISPPSTSLSLIPPPNPCLFFQRWPTLPSHPHCPSSIHTRSNNSFLNSFTTLFHHHPIHSYVWVKKIGNIFMFWNKLILMISILERTIRFLEVVNARNSNFRSNFKNNQDIQRYGPLNWREIKFLTVRSRSRWLLRLGRICPACTISLSDGRFIYQLSTPFPRNKRFV